MGVTVREMLSLNNLEGFEVIAGHEGLSRRVTSVSVMDAPDIYEWLKGGEILITTGYIMKENIDYLTFLIKKINEAGASALFMKVGRFIDNIPTEAIETANKLKIPLVYMPIEYAFTDVINPVLSRIVNYQTEMLRHSENIHNSFTEIVIRGGAIRDIVYTLQDILKLKVVYYDPIGEKTYGESIESLQEELLYKYICYPITLDKKNYGYIVVDKEDYLEDYERIAVEHAATVLKLTIQKQISNEQIEKRYRDQLVQDIVFNNIKYKEEVERRGKIYGWRLEGNFMAVIVDIDDFKIQYTNINDKEENDSIEKISSDIFGVASSYIKSSFPDIIYTTFTDSMVVLVNVNDDIMKAIDKVCNLLREKIQKTFGFTITIGVGSVKSSIMNINESYAEAQKTIRLSRIIYKKNVVSYYENLGVYKILSGIYNTEEAKEFYLEYIEKIIDYDSKFNTEMLITIINIMENNWNLKRSSEAMYIHYNTIKYRYKKLGTIIGKDLDDFQTKLSLEIALKLYLMNKE